MESEHFICSDIEGKQARINGATVSRGRVSQVQEEHVENANEPDYHSPPFIYVTHKQHLRNDHHGKSI